MSGKREIDQLSGVDTTGHEWDGIKELNHPLPRWWLWTLYATIIWSIGYVIVYPAIPGLTGATKGLWNWSSRADVRNEMSAVVQGQQALTDRITAMAPIPCPLIVSPPSSTPISTAIGGLTYA